MAATVLVVAVFVGVVSATFNTLAPESLPLHPPENSLVPLPETPPEKPPEKPHASAP